MNYNYNYLLLIIIITLLCTFAYHKGLDYGYNNYYNNSNYYDPFNPDYVEGNTVFCTCQYKSGEYNYYNPQEE